MAIIPVYLDFASGTLLPVNAASSDIIIGVFPTNYVVMNTDNSDPGVYLGYGTWVSLGSSVIGVTTIYYYKRTA